MRWTSREKTRGRSRSDGEELNNDNDFGVNISRGEVTASEEELGAQSPTTMESAKFLICKLDRNIMPLFCVLYLCSVLDRANLGNAWRTGIREDLHLIGIHDFNIIKSVFFPFYLMVQIPSNLALQRYRPSLWIPSLMVGWSMVTIFIGLVRNFAGLLAMRCLLGLVEGGVFPAIVFYLTKWYKRHEYGFRISMFFSAAVVSGSFNGFLGDAIIKMRGVGGLDSWSWVFFLEGITSLVVSGFAFLLMHDWPGTAKFLRPSERKIVLKRLQEDNCYLTERFNVKFIGHALLDWKIWAHMAMTVGVTIPLYSISEFLPLIVQDLGFTGDRALLMAVPPHIAAAAVTIGVGFAADRCRQRGVFIIGLCLLAMIGFTTLGLAKNHVLRYFACFLIAMGIFPIVPQDVAWNANNIGGTTKRAVGIAMHFGFGNLGGAAAGFIIREDDASRFITAHGILLVTTSFSCLLAIFMTWFLRRENSKRDRDYKERELYTEEQKKAEANKGDEAPFFRYTF
ncbi:hypothetical protein HIM_03590 [Hirsutella minnesotensis 3608]|uniref:Major facilitator superfamily (MFS) profile domain-containing protein n=1 Tax=Hirsutella minnesotensis 3608 TaxID=1043627 RepID=A0A0F8A6L1_9HYPO|nr:hypothetical protein HIM_03590 [Hirsutella minnesotensis 3608]